MLSLTAAYSIHWYLAVIYKPGHTLEPPLPPAHSLNPRETRNRKQVQERAETNLDTVAVSDPALTEASLQRSHFSVQAPEGEPEADTSSMDATRVTTPSTTRDEEIVIDKSCSITVGSEPVSGTSSEIRIRDSSLDLEYPPSDNMDVDVDISIIDVVPNPICEIAEVPDASTSKPSSGIPGSQFYGSVPKPGEAKTVITTENEDSGEDQRQEAEVDDMLAITQSSTGDYPTRYVIL